MTLDPDLTCWRCRQPRAEHIALPTTPVVLLCPTYTFAPYTALLSPTHQERLWQAYNEQAKRQGIDAQPDPGAS